MFPFLFGLLLFVAASACLCIDVLRLRREARARSGKHDVPAPAGSPARDEPGPDGAGRALGYVAISAAVVAGMGWVGFLPAAFGGVLAMVRGLERMPWRTALLTAAGAAIAVDLLFVRLLKVPLPSIPL